MRMSLFFEVLVCIDVICIWVFLNDRRVEDFESNVIVIIRIKFEILVFCNEIFVMLFLSCIFGYFELLYLECNVVLS